jgi:nucleotide-binding universal stress UspA family protein
MPTTVLHIPDASKIEAKKPSKDEDEAAAKGEKTEKNGKSDKEKEKDKEKEDAKKAKESDKKEEKKAEDAGEVVKEAAKEIKAKQKDEEKVDAPVEVTTIVREAPDADVIAEEAKKGYDLLIIGLEKTVARKNEFHESVTGIALGFEGPLLITDVRDELAEEPEDKLSILVPVNGTEVSRRAAEVAITMARASKAPLTVLYVAARETNRSGRRSLRTRQHEEAILKEIVAIADGYNMSIRTAVLAKRSPDQAILQEVERRKHNLIIMGVGRRPGDKLFFGDTAATLLEKSERSLIFVAS